MKSHEDAEALRRRLYLPDASPEDLDAYRAALPAAQPAAHVPTTVDDVAAAAALPGRTSLLTRRRLLGAGAVALGGAGVATALLRTADPSALPASSTRPVRPVVSRPLRLDGADRADLLDNLGRGGAAGIGAYLLTHAPPPALAAATRLVTVERHGTGTGSVALDEEGIGGEGGRATVLVVGAEGTSLDWTALRLGTRDSPVVRLIPVASSSGAGIPGELTAATFAYAAGRRPVRLAVDVRGGARWGAAVVFTD